MAMAKALAAERIKETERRVVDARASDALAPGRNVGAKEIASWQASLQSMAKVLNDDEIPADAGVAIEYTIPPTSKRVDFILTGRGAARDPNAVIVESKQWTETRRTDQDGVVRT